MSHVYLDHNATTPVDEAVLAAMLPFFRGQYGNASSRHEFGTVARRAVNTAREQVAEAVGVQPAQVVFVSGGSEANNLFLKGAAAFLRPAQVAVSGVEHPCVLRPARDLARQGWRLHTLAVDGEGRLEMDDVERALSEPTGIVSVMLANNETGVIQDVAAVAQRARAVGALMHTDAVQAFGKIEVDFAALNVHAMTLSAHKIYGPKGAAALILDKRVALKPLIQGGGHESGLRAGTENVPAIVGFGLAARLAKARLMELDSRLRQMQARLERGLRDLGAIIFGAAAPRLPNTTYFSFPGIDGETLVVRLDREGFGVTAGAACSSASPGPSHVLEAMGIEPELARGAVRVSLGKDNTPAQVEEFLRAVAAVVAEMRRLTAMAV
ncbi:MAG: cysteine desulfurase [Betaproteobacteria bacterium]|nr:cysteine desulfurase [Betaproteobacteria bacterium]